MKILIKEKLALFFERVTETTENDDKNEEKESKNLEDNITNENES